MMQFGVCGHVQRAREARGFGFDYAEYGVAGLLMPEKENAAFEQALAEVQAVGLPCPVLNGFVPQHLAITGPNASLDRLEAYVTTAFERANVAGVECIVFGSGGARRLPDGVDYDTGRAQIAAFAAMLAPLAHAQGVTVVVEPLNVKECNILTTVQESADLVREVNHPGLRLLVDAYHMMMDGDPFESIVANADIITHAHVATVPNRKAPGVEPCEALPAFFAALQQAGYTGRLSIEGNVGDANELAIGLETMRAF